MNTILRILLLWLAVVISAYLIPWVEVANYWIAIIVGLVIALLNMTVGTILRFLTLPLNILTFGLVGFIITVLMIMLAWAILGWFDAGGFRNAALFALALGLLSALFGANDLKKAK